MKEPTGNIVLVVEHTPYQTRSTTKFVRHRKYQRQDPLKVVAHIPGLIVEICCKPGDKIQREDRLVVLDAMKMKNALLATHPGWWRLCMSRPGRGWLKISCSSP